MQAVTAPQLKQRIESNRDLKLIDVLSTPSFQAKHIPGSLNVPFQQATEGTFVDRVKKLGARETDEVVVYCADKSCDLSPRAAKALEAAGFRSVVDFEGGVEAWEKAGFPLGGVRT